MILHTNLYHFILKYNIYIFVYKLLDFLKFGWLLLKPFSYAVSRDLKSSCIGKIEAGVRVPNRYLNLAIQSIQKFRIMRASKNIRINFIITD